LSSVQETPFDGPELLFSTRPLPENVGHLSDWMTTVEACTPPDPDPTSRVVTANGLFCKFPPDDALIAS
jgi:hypothetical protein